MKNFLAVVAIILLVVMSLGFIVNFKADDIQSWLRRAFEERYTEETDENNKPEDPKPEDLKPEDPKPEDLKPEDPKPEDPNPEDSNPEIPEIEFAVDLNASDIIDVFYENKMSLVNDSSSDIIKLAKIRDEHKGFINLGNCDVYKEDNIIYSGIVYLKTEDYGISLYDSNLNILFINNFVFECDDFNCSIVMYDTVKMHEDQFRLFAVYLRYNELEFDDTTNSGIYVYNANSIFNRSSYDPEITHLGFVCFDDCLLEYEDGKYPEKIYVFFGKKELTFYDSRFEIVKNIPYNEDILGAFTIMESQNPIKMFKDQADIIRYLISIM